jgi:23S rRNA (cytidine2498-2'-O)-methyltransferase
LAEIALPAKDRVGAVIAGLNDAAPIGERPGRVEVRLGETNEDGDLGRFARKWVAPLSKGLRGAGLLADHPDSDHPLQLEILLNGFERALVGVSVAGNRARHSSGILRLKFPADAPSRSTLKLEEAWKVFLPRGRELEFLGGGRQAVDLGAAPGGWTWQLVNQGMKVIAVDNGPMDDRLMASGMVEHVRDDGYSWLPRRAVDWMVCDIVDKPRRTAELAARWVAGKHCRYTIFNLKLPMKKRYEEWLACRELISDRLATAEVPFRLTARHLYHDREEITCFLERLDS